MLTLASLNAHAYRLYVFNEHLTKLLLGFKLHLDQQSLAL